MTTRNASSPRPTGSSNDQTNTTADDGSGEAGGLSFRWRWRVAVAAAPKDVLTKREKLLGHTLALRMDEDGVCWPGLDLLVKETGLAESTIRDGRDALAAAGFLSFRSGNGKGNSTRFQALIPPKVPTTGTLPEAAKGADHRSERCRPPEPKVPTTGTEYVREEDSEYATAVAHVREAGGGGESLHSILARLPSAPHSGSQVDEVRAAWEAQPEGVERIVGDVLMPGTRSPFGLLVSKVRNGEHLHEHLEPERVYTRTARPEGTCEVCLKTAALVDDHRCANCNGQEV